MSGLVARRGVMRLGASAALAVGCSRMRPPIASPAAAGPPAAPDPNAVIRNPVLPGFNPDPSLERVGDDFYVVTSSFEWFPGIPIYHSRDLVHWRALGHVLTRRSQLDLTRVADSDGIFAPMLRHHRGRFYVLYTVVSQAPRWPMKGYPNYLVTATHPAGPWSEPVLVDALGFDPSIFFDDDGRVYVAVRVFDHRKGKTSSPGIALHEYDVARARPVGPPRLVMPASEGAGTEGPHVFKRNGWYYLFVAEGGTGYEHRQTIARSRSVWGPYEPAPARLVLTSKDDPALPLQKAGHASLVDTPRGEWYLAHLASRPLEARGRCPLGRETCLQRVQWTDDGWPRLWHGGVEPRVEVPAPALAPHLFPPPPARDDFDGPRLRPEYQWLRAPADESWLSLRRRRGHLSLRGRFALSNVHRVSLVARRITSLRARAETSVDFAPEDFRHMAGLVCYYNSKTYASLHVTRDERVGRCLDLVVGDAKTGYAEPLGDAKVPLPPSGPVALRLDIEGPDLRFAHSNDGRTYTPIGPPLDFSRFSDDYNDGFTGAMVGVAAQDMMYESKWADFDHFTYADG